MAFFFVSLYALFFPNNLCAEELKHPLFIAHAGGSIDGQPYTNSLEALNFNYKQGHRYFEIDFSWTSDGRLVAIHDWGDESKVFHNMFVVPSHITVTSREQFLGLNSKLNLTQLSLEGVLNWVSTKGDAYIITDIKSNNITGLDIIRRNYPDSMNHLIPQVYSYNEYLDAKYLGYKKIILTIYRMKPDPDQLYYFAKMESPYAITMHWNRVGIYAEQLRKQNVKVFAHTINDADEFERIKRLGVHGIYTDHLDPQ